MIAASTNWTDRTQKKGSRVAPASSIVPGALRVPPVLAAVTDDLARVAVILPALTCHLGLIQPIAVPFSSAAQLTHPPNHADGEHG